MSLIGETAELAVLLKLKDEISGPLRNVESALGKVDNQASTVSGGLSKIGSGLKTGLAVGAAAAVGGLVLLGKAVGDGERGLIELDKLNRQTAAAIKSTGGAAGVTAQQIIDMAESLEKLTAIDRPVIQNAENLLLTFTHIGKETFPDATKAVLDMSVALGQDASSAAIQLGKALDNPTVGLTALRRVGVSFTDQQIKQIKTLVEQNKLLDAQKIILTEVNREFGGSASAFGQSAAGKIARLRNTFEELERTLATAMLPVITKVADKLNELLSSPQVVQGAEDLGNAIAGIFSDENIAAAGKFVADILPSVRDGLRLTLDVAKTAYGLFNGLPPELKQVAIAAIVGNKLTGGLVASGVGDIAKALVSGAIKGVLGMSAGVVNINAAVVNGPGGIPGIGGLPGAAAGGGLLAGAAGLALGTAAGGAAIIALANTDIGRAPAPGSPQDIYARNQRNIYAHGAAAPGTTGLAATGAASHADLMSPLHIDYAGQAQTYMAMLNDKATSATRDLQGDIARLPYQTGQTVGQMVGSQLAGPLADLAAAEQRLLSPEFWAQGEKSIHDAFLRAQEGVRGKDPSLQNIDKTTQYFLSRSTDYYSRGRKTEVLLDQIKTYEGLQKAALDRGDTKMANAIGSDIDALKAKYIALQGTTNAKLDGVNSKLATIASKPTNVDVNVSVPLSVNTQYDVSRLPYYTTGNVTTTVKGGGGSGGAKIYPMQRGGYAWPGGRFMVGEVAPEMLDLLPGGGAKITPLSEGRQPIVVNVPMSLETRVSTRDVTRSTVRISRFGPQSPVG